MFGKKFNKKRKLRLWEEEATAQGVEAGRLRQLLIKMAKERYQEKSDLSAALQRAIVFNRLAADEQFRAHLSDNFTFALHAETGEPFVWRKGQEDTTVLDGTTVKEFDIFGAPNPLDVVVEAAS